MVLLAYCCLLVIIVFYLLFQYVLKDSLYLYFFISSISYGVQPSFKGCGAMASVMLDILNLILIGLL